MSSADGTMIYLIVVFVLMTVFIYFAVLVHPMARNKEKFRVNELYVRGGWITIDNTKLRVERGATISVGITLLTITQNGITSRINFNDKSKIEVEVDP